VKRLGILQPITVQYLESENLYQIITGERRFRAAQAAGLTEIPCWVRVPRQEDVLVHQIVENWQRADISPYDLADALARLRDSNGYSQNDLALATGKSKGEISKLLSILELDPEAQSIARNDTTGRVSKRHLYSISRLPKAIQKAIVEKTQHDNISAGDIEALANRELRRASGNDTRGPRHFRRAFKTSRARVVFSFRTDTIRDDDVLEAIEEIRRQIQENES